MRRTKQERQRERQRWVAGVERIHSEGDKLAVGDGERDQDDGKRYENNDEHEAVVHVLIRAAGHVPAANLYFG